MELALDRSDDGEHRQSLFNDGVDNTMNGMDDTLDGVDGDQDAHSVEEEEAHFERGDMISPLTNRSANFDEGSPAGYAVAEAMAAQARALREVQCVLHMHTRFIVVSYNCNNHFSMYL